MWVTKSAAIARADKLSKWSLHSCMSKCFYLFGAHGYSSHCTTKHLLHSISTQNHRNMQYWDWSEPRNLGINFPVIRHFSSSLQNAYPSEELNGLLYYQNKIFFQLSIFFQLQGGFAPDPLSDQGLCPWTPLGALPPDPHYRLALRARIYRPPLFRRNRRHWCSQTVYSWDVAEAHCSSVYCRLQ